MSNQPRNCSAVSFDNVDIRDDEMHSTIETWVKDLIDLVDDATTSQEFQEWLDIQSRFHDYSHRNTLLIKLQYPEATRVAGYRTWQTEFDRHVQKGEEAIWIWAPIITSKCPDCGNSPSYHERSTCEYDETPPEEWSKGLCTWIVSLLDLLGLNPFDSCYYAPAGVQAHPVRACAEVTDSD